MTIIYALLIFACGCGIGWILGRNRGQNDQISIKCDDCAIHQRYSASLLEIRDLRDFVHSLKSSNGKLAVALQNKSFMDAGFRAR